LPPFFGRHSAMIIEDWPRVKLRDVMKGETRPIVTDAPER